MQQKNRCQSVFSFLTKFDLYGQKLELWIDSNRTVKSKFGALLSLMIISFCIYLFYVNIISWSSSQNLQTISSSQSLSINELFMKNKSLSYSFNYSNFNIYFVLSASFPDGSMINHEQLQNYFTQSFYYQNQYSETKDLKYEKCSERKRLEFLGLDYSNIDENATSKWGVCVPQNYLMGLFTDNERKVVNTSALGYKISKCKNSTENNNSCSSDEEIIEMLKYISIQVSLPKSVYDFNNPTNARKTTYDYEFYHLDFEMQKLFTSYLLPVYLKTDNGIYEEDYALNSISFNVDKTVYETLLRRDNNDEMFLYELTFGFDVQTYYRKNEKIYIFFANFGGIMNILFLLGKIISYLYNRAVYMHNLINISFTNLEKYNIYKPIDRQPDLGLDFSFFRIMLPQIFHKKIYTEALEHLYEYLDIKNIIKRLQDVDKLKMVLFDEHQRKLFETIPKPGLIGKSTSNTSFLTMKAILLSKEPLRIATARENYEKFLSGEKISSRIMQLLEPKFKLVLEMMNENKIERPRKTKFSFFGFQQIFAKNSNRRKRITSNYLKANFSQKKSEIKE